MLVVALVATMLSVVPASSAGAAAQTAAVVSASTQAKTAATPQPRWKPPIGAAFNDPTGGPKARAAIVSRVRQAIRHTKKGATIRFSTYTFDRNDVAELLIKAKRRGVHVQIVVNDHTPKTSTLPDHTEDAGDPDAEEPKVKPINNTAQKRLVRVLGQKRSKPSFIYFCKGSCRNGAGGNLHTKIYSFSQTGASKYVIISTSGNMTYGASFAQWNDAYTVRDDRQLFRAWVTVFRQFKNDRKVAPRHIGYNSPDRAVAFQRQLAKAQGGTTEVQSARAGSGDAAYDRLSRVGCVAPAGFGISGHTVVKIAMYAWYGGRGDKIARKVADLRRAGCIVRVIGSVLGDSTAGILVRAGIPVRAADWDFGDRVSTDGQKIVTGPRCYSHYKFFTVSGAYDGAGLRAVWTGSENWSSVSYGNDEVTLRLNGRPVYLRYTARFDKMFRNTNASHPVGTKPTRRPCANG